MFSYYAPFSNEPVKISKDQLDSVLKAAEWQTTRSLDGRELRKTDHSGDLGFLEVRVTVNDKYRGDRDELASVLGTSTAPGIRGSRAVILRDVSIGVDGDDEIFQAWIGRNVWYNHRRLTAGWPSTDEEVEDVVIALDDVFREHVRVRAVGHDYGPEEIEDDGCCGAGCGCAPDEDGRDEDGAGDLVEVSVTIDQVRTIAEAMKTIADTVLDIIEQTESRKSSPSLDGEVEFREFGDLS